MAERGNKDAGASATVKQDGDLSVAFANTASDKRPAPRDYADLLLWLERHGALSSRESLRYRALAAERPEEAEAAFSFALELRNLLARIYNEIADRRELTPKLIEAFNARLASLPRQHLVPAAKSGLRWAWIESGKDDLGRPLWDVIAAAARLLASKLFAKIRRCARADCDLLFAARNPGSPRRWCSMSTCGRRTKSHRHYHLKVKPAREKWKSLPPEEQRRRLGLNKPRRGRG